jgi:hypothetical protein
LENDEFKNSSVLEKLEELLPDSENVVYLTFLVFYLKVTNNL